MAKTSKMAVHLLKVRRTPFGAGELRGSLCGRLNASSTDGMNVTDNEAEVTCHFCRKIMAYRGKNAA